MADNSAPGLSIATALFFTWSVLTFGVRAWVKSRRSENQDWDNYTIFAALVVALLHVITVFKSIDTANNLSIQDLSSGDKTTVEKTFFASEIFYVLSLGLTRVSTGFFITRFTRHGTQMQIGYVFTALCGLWTLISIPLIAIRGDLKQPWATLGGSNILYKRWIGVESSGLLMEVLLWGLCINIIWTLSMPIVRRVFILAIFGCRLLMVPIVVLRLIWLSPDHVTDDTTLDTTANILTEAVLNYALMSACVTCLKPFLQPFDSEYVVSTVHSENAAWPANSTHKSRESYYRLSTVSNASKKHDVLNLNVKEINFQLGGHDNKNGQSLSATGSMNAQSLRPDRYEQHVTVTASPRPSSSRDDNDSGEMIIRKTEEWSVRIEEEQHHPWALKAQQLGVAV